MVSNSVVKKWILSNLYNFIVNFVQFFYKIILFFSYSIKKIQAKMKHKSYYNTSQKVILLKIFVIFASFSA